MMNLDLGGAFRAVIRSPRRVIAVAAAVALFVVAATGWGLASCAPGGGDPGATDASAPTPERSDADGGGPGDVAAADPDACEKAVGRFASAYLTKGGADKAWAQNLAKTVSPSARALVYDPASKTPTVIDRDTVPVAGTYTVKVDGTQANACDATITVAPVGPNMAVQASVTAGTWYVSAWSEAGR